MTAMFELWKLRRARSKVLKAYEEDRRKLVKRKAPQEDIYALEAQEYSEVREVDRAIDMEMSDRVWRTANELDVDIPPAKDGTVWFSDDHTGRLWLTPKGRFVGVN